MNTPKFNIRLSVVFGSPKKSCAGNGICKMLPMDRNLRPKNYCCPSVNARLSWYSNGTFTLSFMDLQQAPFGSFFQEGRELFLVEDDFFFPPWLALVIQEKGIVFPKGYYPIQRHNSQQICIQAKWHSVSQNTLQVA